MKRYDHEVELIQGLKDADELTIKARSVMIEQKDGEYICVKDLPRWVRLILKLW